MSLFVRPPDLVCREAIRVMQASCPDELPEIQKLWPWFEDLVGLRGRKMYAAVDLTTATYSACTAVRPDEDPESLGLQVGELPGGQFRRGRLRGEPPEVYAFIGPGFEELQSTSRTDETRPLIEFYKRYDAIELLVPVLE